MEYETYSSDLAITIVGIYFFITVKWRQTAFVNPSMLENLSKKYVYIMPMQIQISVMIATRRRIDLLILSYASDIVIQTTNRDECKCVYTCNGNRF